MRRSQINLDFVHRRAHITRNVEIEVVGLDLVHVHTPSIAFNAERSFPIGADDLGDMIVCHVVLPLALLEALGGVDEEHIIGLFAFLQH